MESASRAQKRIEDLATCLRTPTFDPAAIKAAHGKLAAIPPTHRKPWWRRVLGWVGIKSKPAGGMVAPGPDHPNCRSWTAPEPDKNVQPVIRFGGMKAEEFAGMLAKAQGNSAPGAVLFQDVRTFDFRRSREIPTDLFMRGEMQRRTKRG